MKISLDFNQKNNEYILKVIFPEIGLIDSESVFFNLNKFEFDRFYPPNLSVIYRAVKTYLVILEKFIFSLENSDIKDFYIPIIFEDDDYGGLETVCLKIEKFDNDFLILWYGEGNFYDKNSDLYPSDYLQNKISINESNFKISPLSPPEGIILVKNIFLSNIKKNIIYLKEFH